MSTLLAQEILPPTEDNIDREENIVIGKGADLEELTEPD